MTKESTQQRKMSVNLASRVLSLDNKSVTLDQSLSNAYTEETENDETSLFVEYGERKGEDNDYEFL